MTTFFSVPTSDVTRTVSFTIDVDQAKDAYAFSHLWNNPMHGHVLSMHPIESDTPSVSIMNMSNEPMILVANSPTLGAYVIGHWHANEAVGVPLAAITSGHVQPSPYVIVLQDTTAFKCTAYLHRKKTNQPYYVREESVWLPKGVYTSIGHVAATLNQGITMRGERNGYIFHFVTHGGKLSVEASHKQPEPSFMEIVPLHTGLGLMEQDVVRLRTKERLDFPYGACCLI